MVKQQAAEVLPVAHVDALVAALRRDVLEPRQVLQPVHQLLPRDVHRLWCSRIQVCA